jgi:acyl carrier protein
MACRCAACPVCAKVLCHFRHAQLSPPARTQSATASLDRTSASVPAPSRHRNNIAGRQAQQVGQLVNVESLRAVLAQIRPEFDFSVSRDFISDGMLDSFDIVLLVSALDKQFGICIDGREIVPQNFCNLEAISELLKKHGVTP